MVKKQMNRQYSGTVNLQHLTSNPEPLLTTPALWFQISWGDLNIIPFVMVMLSFTFQVFQLNLTLNMFHIQKPLQLNELIMMKRTIF